MNGFFCRKRVFIVFSKYFNRELLVQTHKIILILLLTSLTNIFSQVTFEVYFGTQYNVPTPLKIELDTPEETIFIEDAKYNPDAFTGFNSPYYSWRLGFWNDKKAWELELVHEKIILINKPENVQLFEISHGYNLVTINRAIEQEYLIYRLGAGFVLAHPETKIYGKSMGNRGVEKELPLGFSIAGPTLQGSLGTRQLKVFKGLFAVLETKVTMSYAIVKVADGKAYVPNFAFHGLFGFGYEF